MGYDFGFPGIEKKNKMEGVTGLGFRVKRSSSQFKSKICRDFWMVKEKRTRSETRTRSVVVENGRIDLEVRTGQP